MGADQSTSRRNRLLQDHDRSRSFPGYTSNQSSSGESSIESRSDPRTTRHSISEHGTRNRGTLVVVKPALEKIDVENDPVSVRLRGVPSFDPILLNRDKLAWTKEGERARQRIDPSPLLNIGLLFQTRVRREATFISKKQTELSRQIKTVDNSIGLMIKAYTDRQRKAAKHAERFNKINDFAHLLAKCQAVLNDCKRTCLILNEMLPGEDRLEPFVWAEDRELIQIKESETETNNGEQRRELGSNI